MCLNKDPDDSTRLSFLIESNSNCYFLEIIFVSNIYGALVVFDAYQLFYIHIVE